MSNEWMSLKRLSNRRLFIRRLCNNRFSNGRASNERLAYRGKVEKRFSSKRLSNERLSNTSLAYRSLFHMRSSQKRLTYGTLGRRNLSHKRLSYKQIIPYPVAIHSAGRGMHTSEALVVWDGRRPDILGLVLNAHDTNIRSWRSVIDDTRMTRIIRTIGHSAGLNSRAKPSILAEHHQM